MPHRKNVLEAGDAGIMPLLGHLFEWDSHIHLCIPMLSAVGAHWLINLMLGYWRRENRDKSTLIRRVNSSFCTNIARVGYPWSGVAEGSEGGTKSSPQGAGVSQSAWGYDSPEAWGFKVIHSPQCRVLRGQENLIQGYIFIKICSILNSRGTCAFLRTEGKSLWSWP